MRPCRLSGLLLLFVVLLYAKADGNIGNFILLAFSLQPAAVNLFQSLALVHYLLIGSSRIEMFFKKEKVRNEDFSHQSLISPETAIQSLYCRACRSTLLWHCAILPRRLGFSSNSHLRDQRRVLVP